MQVGEHSNQISGRVLASSDLSIAFHSSIVANRRAMLLSWLCHRMSRVNLILLLWRYVMCHVRSSV